MITNVDQIGQEIFAPMSRVMLCHGSFESLKGKPGEVYDHIAFEEICARVKNPTALPKKEADFIIPSGYVGHDARAHAIQRVRGVYRFLCVDIDKGNHSLAEVRKAVRKIVGNVAWAIYSTATSTAEDKKWRVILRINSDVPGAEFSAYQTALFDALEAEGIACDRSLARTGQATYLPNVPVEFRDEQGEPHFYEHHLNEYPAGPGTGMVDFGVRLEETLKPAAMKIIAENATKAASMALIQEVTKRKVDPATPWGWASMTFPLETLLEQYGYEPKQDLYGGFFNDWKSPYSSGFSTRVYGDHFVTLSYTDAMKGIGRAAGSVGAEKGKTYQHRYGGALDLIAHFQFGGDLELATAAIQEEMDEEHREKVKKLGAGVARLADAVGVELPSGRNKSLPEFDWSEWYFLTNQNAFANALTGALVVPAAFDQANTLQVEEINVGTDEKPKMARVKPSRYFALQGFPVVHDWMYAPDMPAVFEHERKRWLNSYNEASIPTPVDGDAWKLCQRHLERMLPDDWPTVVQWMAYIVQNPGKKIRWALVIKGAEGDGKTTTANMLKAAIGAANVCIVGDETIRSNFNGYAEGSQLVVLEEIRAKGESRFDVLNRLKPLITNDVVDINDKNRRSKNVRNVSSYLCLTNYEDALPLDRGDRRYHVIFTPFTDRDETKAAFGKEYFDALYEVINYHAGEIRRWLLDVDTSGFNPNDLPEASASKEKMIAAAQSDDAYMVREIIEDGKFPGINGDFILAGVMSEKLKDHGHLLQGKKLHRVLTELGYVQDDDQIRVDSKSYRLWVKKRSDLWQLPADARREVVRARMPKKERTAAADATVARLIR